ncbi:glycine cleavage system protein GcvH [Oceanobacillus indicireducens]|uniref:Glycine cleavage system H protein n=2 Tax=Oceanobacillus TaxID=182709 RepID=A0A917Y1V5_9BACI|nr:glycine cleavage system protein GcvH [Oceanobacillus indicireducens]GGN61814.1 glycine cleavage system H protein [Oceanobacillus indicireducens]
MNLPEDLRYTKEHEWIKKESDNKVRIGITDFAQDELGDIVFVELPEEGDTVEADDSFGSVESVKTVSELYAPVKGTIVEINEELEDSPELVNESPYEQAWMIVVELEDASEWDNLLTAEEYKAIIEED